MSESQGARRRTSTGEAAHLSSFSLDVVAEIRELFNKTATYIKPPLGTWNIPDPSQLFVQKDQQHSHLQALKKSLNEVKNQLSDKNLEVWHQHTSYTNRAGKIIAHVRTVANAEICTQAWCKFYEILGTFGVIPEKALQCGEFNSVHLCEAPGAFIASLNHYLKSSSLYCDWTWVANTLNPYHEGNASGTMITDDRLIVNTLPWWFFGSDNTGDIMVQKHLIELQVFIQNMCTVDLVTADGSFDCQGNPDEQEALVAPLHYCEAVTALLLLDHGGSFVLKMFTLFEHSSVCLLYLMNCCFHSVHVIKPATSKAGNSEVYVVCLDYCAKDDIRPLLAKMMRSFGPDITSRGALFPKELIPLSFLKQHEEICSYFHKHQIHTIRQNLQLFCTMSSEQQQRLDQLRDYAVEYYMKRFQVQYLHRSKWISRNSIPGCMTISKLFGPRKPMGSFNERKELQLMTWKEKVAKGYYKKQTEDHVVQGMGTDCVLVGPAGDCDLHTWYVLVGAALDKVRSSPFCDLELLSHLNEALEQSELVKHSPSVGALTCACSLCQVLSPSSVLADVLGHSPSGDDVQELGCRCIVLGSSSFLSCFPEMDETLVKVSHEALCLTSACWTLHDAEPQYQQEFLTCILRALRRLQAGASLVLPVLTALTRFTAGVILALHQCFRSITFRCPTSSDVLGSVAMLLCIDYQPPSNGRLLEFLQDMCCQMSSSLKTGAKSSQVLQFVPMDVLLKGALPEFLWNMNTAITRHRLHLLVQAEHKSMM